MSTSADAETWAREKLAALKDILAGPSTCYCTGACIVNGVRGPCPIKSPTLAQLVEFSCACNPGSRSAALRAEFAADTLAH